jgi:hypothetical protein
MPAAATAVSGYIELIGVIRTTGTTGTTRGNAINHHQATTPLVSATTSVTVNTTVSNIIEMTFISGQAANGYIFSHATIEIL